MWVLKVEFAFLNHLLVHPTKVILSSVWEHGFHPSMIPTPSTCMSQSMTQVSHVTHSGFLILFMDYSQVITWLLLMYIVLSSGETSSPVGIITKIPPDNWLHVHRPWWLRGQPVSWAQVWANGSYEPVGGSQSLHNPPILCESLNSDLMWIQSFQNRLIEA